MVKGDPHEILQASLARLQNEGLTEIILEKVQNSLAFDIYKEKNEAQAREMVETIRKKKKNFKLCDRRKIETVSILKYLI